MAKKALLTWNIRAGNEREHFKHVRDFVAKLPNVGLELEDAWYTVYGSSPQVLLGVVGQERHEEHLEEMLRSEEWEQLISEFKQYIADYRQRIINIAVGSSRFQI